MKKEKNGFTWLLDAGHGGIIDNKYQTAGKRSYFKNGQLLDLKNKGVDWCEKNCDFKVYEGVTNRDIVARIKKLCDEHQIKYVDVVDSQTDVPLSTRVQRANAYYAHDKDSIYLSIHSDAFNIESAQGFSVYTTPGFTNSDKIALYIFKEMAIEFSDHKPRPDYTDGDPDKEAQFYVLKNTAMPAVLSENLFYTNWREAQIIGSEEGRERIANAHFRAMMYIEKNGF